MRTSASHSVPSARKLFRHALLAASFVALGRAALAQCTVVPPLSVDVTSSAYQQVVEDDPTCCFEIWDGICQAAYDELSGTSGAPPNNLCFSAQFVGDGMVMQSTAGATTSAQGTCLPDDGADVWFIYVATCNGTVTMNTCGSSFNTSLTVYSICGGAILACNNDWCGTGSFVSFQATVGTSYHVRAAGAAGATGDLVFSTACNTAACPVEAPPGVDVAHPAYLQVVLAQPECCYEAWGESCQSAYDAIVTAPPANDLCSQPLAIVDDAIGFSNLNAGTEAAASCVEDDAGDVWFRYVASCSGIARIATCGSAFNTSVAVFNACGGQEIACDVGSCGTGGRIFLPVQAGSAYRIRVAGVAGEAGNGTLQVDCISPDACSVAPPQGVDIDSPAYVQTILDLPECCGVAWSEACQQAYDGFGIVTPPNDLCTGAVPQVLPPGSSIVFNGDNTGATDDEDGSVLVWEAFTLTACSDVTIAHCLPGFLFEEFDERLITDCTDMENAFILGTGDDCAFLHQGLPPGTYHIPVRVRPGVTPIGAYAFQVRAVACSGYCDAEGADGGGHKIASVQCLDIGNISGGIAGYEDFTSIGTDMPSDSAHEITIIVAEGGPGTQVSVWIDLNADLAFAPSELLFTSEPGAGPHTGILSIPADANIGATRMRIRAYDLLQSDPPGPCGASSSGQVEDYTVVIDQFAAVPPGLEHFAFTLFPNPTNGSITLRQAGFEGALNIQVLDMTGRIVHAQRVMSSKGSEVVLGHPGWLARGVYAVRITAQDRQLEQRFVVR